MTGVRVVVRATRGELLGHLFFRAAIHSRYPSQPKRSFENRLSRDHLRTKSLLLYFLFDRFEQPHGRACLEATSSFKLAAFICLSFHLLSAKTDER